MSPSPRTLCAVWVGTARKSAIASFQSDVGCYGSHVPAEGARQASTCRRRQSGIQKVRAPTPSFPRLPRESRRMLLGHDIHETGDLITHELISYIRTLRDYSRRESRNARSRAVPIAIPATSNSRSLPVEHGNCRTSNRKNHAKIIISCTPQSHDPQQSKGDPRVSASRRKLSTDPAPLDRIRFNDCPGSRDTTQPGPSDPNEIEQIRTRQRSIRLNDAERGWTRLNDPDRF